MFRSTGKECSYACKIQEYVNAEYNVALMMINNGSNYDYWFGRLTLAEEIQKRYL